MSDWAHKDEWKRHGKDFLVVVSRHSVNLAEPSSSCYDDDGGNRWAIYAYIYPKHPHFAKFEGDHLWQDATNLRMHGGCSFLRRHFRKDGEVLSIQVGADYNHLHDGMYTWLATSQDAFAVFEDAAELFDLLESMVVTV